MELDSLKELWNSQATEPERDEEYYRALLNMRSNSPIARMQRNLLFELVVVLLLYGGVAIFYFVAFAGVWTIVSWIYIALGAFYVVYFYRKYKLLSQMQCITCHVKSNLRRMIESLEKFVRFYLFSGTVMVFVLFWFFWFMLAINVPHLGDKSVFFPSSSRSYWQAGATAAFPILVITGISHLLTKWTINKLYGRHIRKLQEILSQMEMLDN